LSSCCSQSSRGKNCSRVVKNMSSPATKIMKGVVWPGQGSVADVSKAVFAASAMGIDDSTSGAVAEEKKWRENYVTHVNRHTEMCLVSPVAALQAAQQGMDFLYENFRFSREGQNLSIQDAMKMPLRPCPYRAVVIKGEAGKDLQPKVVVPWSISHQHDGPALMGPSLEAEVAAAVSRGIMEPSVLTALQRMHQEPEALPSVVAHTAFVAIGAGSAMCPVETLLSLGATVVAIDMPFPAMWKRLIAFARNSPGTLVLPVRASTPHAESAADVVLAEAAGCSCIEDTPEILDWLLNLDLSGRRLAVGAYAYADGPSFVRATLAMDAIFQGLVASRPKGDVSLTYLCSPTDSFAVPVEARAESERRRTLSGLGSRALWQRPLSSTGRFLQPNESGKGKPASGLVVGDAFVTQQGPNYMLAKRLQHWRAMLCRSQGVPVSANIAPASHTVSVRKAKILAAAYDGCKHFGVEIFNTNTSRTLMTALLIHDLKWPEAADGSHPMALFAHGACHNGFWRMPYVLRSVVEVAAGLQLAANYKVPHLLGAGLAAGAAFMMPKSRLSRL